MSLNMNMNSNDFNEVNNVDNISKLTKSLTTIVSCYYKIKSKHTHDNYNIWMRNMLENVETPMIIFTDEENEGLIREYRNKKPLYLLICKMEDFHTAKYYKEFCKSYEIDPEKAIHNPLLYMIWNEKTAFINRASNINPFASDYFMWVDIGCFRNREECGDIPPRLAANFPNDAKIKVIPHNKILFLQTCDKILPHWRHTTTDGLTHHDFIKDLATISGTMFISHISMVGFLFNSYYNMLELFIKNKRFIGKDQNIMMNLAMKYTEEIFIMPKCFKGDPWFGFHWIFL